MEYTLDNLELWFQGYPGAMLLEQECAQIAGLLSSFHGEHLVQIGGPSDTSLVASSPILHQVYASPYTVSALGRSCVQSDLSALALMPSSIDVIVLPHLLAICESPKAVLAQIYDALVPDGYCIILGFNPHSLWGLAHCLGDRNGFPWCGKFHSMGRVKRWLRSLNFKVIASHSFCYTPPLRRPQWQSRLDFLEKIGPLCLPALGGAYYIAVQKQVIAATPIKASLWEKQQSYDGGYVEPTTRVSTDESINEKH